MQDSKSHLDKQGHEMRWDDSHKGWAGPLTHLRNSRDQTGRPRQKDVPWKLVSPLQRDGTGKRIIVCYAEYLSGNNTIGAALGID